MTTYKTLVIGLGKIGMGYDFDFAANERILTHVQSFFSHKGFELVGGIDPDTKKRDDCANKFGIPVFESLEDALSETQPDVVSIAVPTQHHQSCLDDVLNISGVKAILLEKPVSFDLDSAQAMLKKCEETGVPILVNYMRRCEPGAKEVKQLISSGQLGEIQKCVCTYSNGLVNNGSHIVDLLRFWIGDIDSIERIASDTPWKDNDPQSALRLTSNKTDIYFIPVDGNHYYQLDLHVFGTKGKISYLNAGQSITHHRVMDDPNFPGDSIVSVTGDEIQHDFLKYQYHVTDHLYQHLICGTPLNSTIQTATETLKTLTQIAKA